MDNTTSLPSSFRDPSGSILSKNGSIYRVINPVYKEDYDRLMRSGLYDRLVEGKYLVPHSEEANPQDGCGAPYKVIKPEIIQFISYPYEWCFGQLKDAALATLKIQKEALSFGMTLKDASAYNIQFSGGRPLLIDTLSFQGYKEGEPWGAYRQFCQHFLAPLALASYRDIRLSQLSRIFMDGIPLSLAGPLFPAKALLNPSLIWHVSVHAGFQKRYEDKPYAERENISGISRFKLLALIDNLEATIRGLRWAPSDTAWVDYYDTARYTAASFQHKKETVEGMLDKISPKIAWDLGANTGVFSRLAGKKGAHVISIDSDPAAVENNYLRCLKDHQANILPLVIDLSNPSPAIGWENSERLTLTDRGPADAVLALALIHHLAISNNLPLDRIAQFFKKICRSLIIEFIPDTDPQAKSLIAARGGVTHNYSLQTFEEAFGRYFSLERSIQLLNSERTIYLFSLR